MNTQRLTLSLLFLCFYNTNIAQTTFVGWKSSGWKYREAYQDAVAIGNGSWKTNAYSDAAWASGQATLAYDDFTPTHTINTWLWPAGTKSFANASKTHYFRKSFNVSNATLYTGYRIKTWCDDGVVVYLNGKEVLRLNMPAGTIDSLSLASSSSSVVSPPGDSLYGETTIYVPTDLLTGTNVISVELHQFTNSLDRYFDLSIEGIDAPSTCSEWPVMFKSTGWKYREAYQDAAAIGNGTWKTNAYSDVAWANGQATLGYENTLPVTHALNTWLWPYNAALNGTNTSKTHYFRKCFNVSNPASFSGYKIKTWCDDGLVVYLNNKEVVRLNMPAGTIDSLTLAPTAPANDSIYSETTINLPSDLLTGTNVIAVEVHQFSGSIDRYFDLSIEGVIAGCPTITLKRQPYLQIATPTSVVVRWKTNLPSNGILKYGTDVNNLTNVITVPSSDTIHIVNLTGLTPNTKYYYSVSYSCGATETLLASGSQYYYQSMPNNTTDQLRFWVLGDVCSGDNRQDNVRDAYINYLGANRLHGILFGGDNSLLYPYDGKDPALDYAFFGKYPNQFRNIPFWAILGNHDYTYKPYNDTTVASYNAFSYPKLAEAGGIASNSKGYYSFDVGDVHFVMLNPYHADFNVRRTSAVPGCSGGSWDCITLNKNMYMLKFDDAATQATDFNNLQQVKWLKLDLAATTKKWKIVMFHIPPYTKGSHDSDPRPYTDWEKTDGELKVVRELLVPVLEQYKVDLIVTSHTHSYARSFLMKGVTGTPTKTEFQADRTKLLQSNSGKYTPVPVTKPYIKNSPYNGAVHVVTGNAGRGSATSGQDSPTGTSHPVMFYSDSTATLAQTGGSVELLINKNRLDVKYLKLDSDAGTAYHIQDEFTIMKDVNKKTTYNNPSLPLSLTASWEGTYNWRILGGANLGVYTKSYSVSPSANTTYIVTDGYNGVNGFLADTFVVVTCPPNLTFSTTIGSSSVYEASQWIKATNTNIIAPSATVEYRAGYVEILPNANGTAFLATPSAGHYFLAVPAGCTPPAGRVAVAELENVIPPKKIPLKLPLPAIRK